jgi:hypothetical protein
MKPPIELPASTAGEPTTHTRKSLQQHTSNNIVNRDSSSAHADVI